MTRIAVAGATGRVGRQTVDVLHEGGHDVVAISRSNGVDVITGDGLAAALEGVEVVIDAATGPSPEQGPATEFFTTAIRNLEEAGGKAGVRRLVEMLMGWGRQGDVVYLPKMRTQSVAASTVAEELAAVALSDEPEGARPAEIAGPREEYLPDLAALLAAKRGEEVKIEAVSHPEDPDDVLAENGGLLPSPHAKLAGPTFAEWLDAGA